MDVPTGAESPRWYSTYFSHRPKPAPPLLKERASTNVRYNSWKNGSVLPEHSNYPALYLHGFCRNDDRIHGAVGGLQADLHAFAVETLQSGVIAFHQRDNNFAIAGGVGFLYQHVIAVHDVLVPHALALHLKDEYIFGARDISERDGIALRHGLNRLAGSDAPHQRQSMLNRSSLGHLAEEAAHRQQIDRAAAVVIALEQAFSLQVGDVLVHRRQRAKIKPRADLFEGW